MTVTTISFHESSLPSETYITQLADAGPPYAVHGVALGAGDVTKGASGVKKQWPASELKKSADSLEGTNLVVDHENNADGVVGTVTKAGYKEGTGIVYEAELYDEDLADKIENGLLEVSIRGYHSDVDDLEKDDDTGALIVENITFDNLSIVPQGASPSNTLKMGEHEELSAAELQSFTASLMEDVGPGEWVSWDDGKHGITISEPSDGEIEVDVYSESDGQWRSQGETMTVDIDVLSEWDVEESDIGPVQESDDSEENVAECMSIPMPGDAQLLYPSQELAEKAAEMIGIEGTHPHDYEGEEWYMPGDNHEVFVEKMDDMSSEENSPLITEGMKFFSTVNDSQIVVKDVSGRIALVGTMDNESQWKEEIDNIIRKLADGDWEHAGHVSSDASSDMIDDAEAYSEMIDPPEWEEGDMVQWQVNSDMRGRVVHNPDDREYVMVEVFEDGEPSGYTLTAGYTDLEHARERSEEEMSDAKFKRGDWVEWDTRNSTEIGKVIGGYTKGDDLPDFRGSRGLSPDEGDILYALRMYDERDGTFHPIEGKAIGHYEKSLRSAEEPANVSDSYVELSTVTDESSLKSVAVLKASPQIDRPSDGDSRAVVHVPVTNQITDKNMDSISQTIESELGMSVMSDRTDRGILFGPIEASGDGKRDFEHLHLDVIESAVDNEIGISQKSTLFAAGSDEMYVQPCYSTSEEMPEDVLNEITRLLKFVTGVDANAYYSNDTLMLGTGQQALSHASLDVAEILVRRMGDANDITVDSNMFMVSDMDTSETGHHDMDEEENARSNHDEYDVEEEDWVQWYPSETTEEHGFVLDVDDSAGGEDESIVTIEVWTQNQDGEWETDGEEITKPMSLVEPWGNFPREQEEFADAIDGEDPRRAVKPSEEENMMPDTSASELISDQVKQALKDKAEKHNEEHGDEDGKEVTYRMLKNVFNRGMGAYQDSHREGMSPQQWSYARVNAFLYLVRNGNPENDAYTQDNDLLPEDHPKYNENPDEEENESVFQNALTTRDAIVREVFGEHDPMGGDEVESPEEIVERVVTAELSSDEDELDEVYEDWDDAVNMTASSLREWSGHPCSREASLDPVAVIRRNLELLETNKSDWTTSHIDDAKRTISFISRMKGADTADLDGGPYGCPSKRDISLMNWAFNPFESIPSVPSDADDELGDVDEVELVRGEAEEPVIRSIRDRIRMMRNSPERFSRQQVNRVAERIDGNIYGSQVADLGVATDDGETRSGEASDVASLAEYEMHEVEFEGSHEGEWNRPNLEDFVEAMDIDEDISEYDDLTRQAQEDVASAFLISASGFPADDYGDLKLPVVEPNGELSVRALAAVKGGRGASEVDGLSEEMESDIIDYVNQLAEQQFNRNWSEENAMPKHYGEKDDEEYMGSVPDSHMFESREDAEEKAEDMGIEGAHMMDGMYVPGDTHEMYAMAKEEMSDSDSVMVALPVQTDTKNIKITNMSNLEEELGDLDSPVAVEADELEALEQKADRLDTMSESIEELRERTEVMDEVDQSALEELQDADDPMIIESAEYEELEEEASQVKEMYAASLAEEYDAFSAEELSDKYSVATLREKFESVIGDVSEELSASSEQAQPRSQDPSEEELSSQSNGSSEELEQSVKERQEQIREKILSN